MMQAMGAWPAPTSWPQPLPQPLQLLHQQQQQQGHLPAQATGGCWALPAAATWGYQAEAAAPGADGQHEEAGAVAVALQQQLSLGSRSSGNPFA
jgi:hypothetical protein